MMDRLPPELVVRVLMQLEPEDLSRCDQLSRRFHGLTSVAEKALGLIMHIESDELLQERFRLWYGQQHSLVEEALRRLATDGGYTLPETLPSNHVNWTQALLFLAMLRRDSNRQRVAATRPRDMSIDDDDPDDGPYDGPFRGSSAFLDANGTLLMCGAHSKYHARELRRGQEIRQNIPASIAGLTGVCVQSIAASSTHTIVLAVDGTAYSWGKGRDGALGHGDLRDVAQPTRISALSNVCAITTGDTHALAITADGSLWSWGALKSDQKYLGHGDETLGDELLLPKRIEALAGLRICAVSTGPNHSLAACADRGFFSWGRNTCHVLGLRLHEIKQLPHFEVYAGQDEDARAYASVPHRVHALRDERVRSCAASDACSYAVTAQGAIWRWGELSSDGREIAMPRTTEELPWTVDLLPAALVRTPLDGLRVVSVALSEVHALAITADGAVHSWWLRNAFPMELNRIRGRLDRYDVLGHGDAHDAPLERVCSPRLIEALAGQQICSIAACHAHSIAAGWTNNAAGDAPAPDGLAQRPQWARWSWGLTLPTEREQNRLGHGEYHTTANLPRRVMGIGGNQSESTAANMSRS